MIGTMLLNGESRPIVGAQLHFPAMWESRYMDLVVEGEGDTSFSLRFVEVPLLKRLDELDGRRLHIHCGGDGYDDDDLGTDIVGTDDLTDTNAWIWEYVTGVYFYGDIQIDFRRIDGRRYRCDVRCQLTQNDESPVDELAGDAFILGEAHFEVEVDEENPNRMGG